MSKRTRIAVVVAALLLGAVGPVIAADGNRQAAQASTVDMREVSRVYQELERIIPRTGWMRNGRPAFLAPPMRWRLEKVACTVNQAHDLVYDYQVDDQLRQQFDLGDDAWRYQSALLRLSDQLQVWKQGAGPVYEQGSEWFCDHVDERLEQVS
jgi:hypothetical protein